MILSLYAKAISLPKWLPISAISYLPFLMGTSSCGSESSSRRVRTSSCGSGTSCCGSGTSACFLDIYVIGFHRNVPGRDNVWPDVLVRFDQAIKLSEATVLTRSRRSLTKLSLQGTSLSRPLPCGLVFFQQLTFG